VGEQLRSRLLGAVVVAGAVLFFVRTIGDFAEQILEERRERAQGQTSFLDEEE
jgi:hypothetical protein